MPPGASCQPAAGNSHPISNSSLPMAIHGQGPFARSRLSNWLPPTHTRPPNTAPMPLSPTAAAFRRRSGSPTRARWSKPTAASFGEIRLLAVLLVVANPNRRKRLVALVRSARALRLRRGKRLWAVTRLRLLTQELLQRLIQVSAHLALHAAAVRAYDVDHELLRQNRLGQMLLLGDDLQQYAARDVRIVLLVHHNEVDSLYDQPSHVPQGDVPAFDGIVEAAIRIFFNHSRIAHRAPRSCWPTRYRKMPVRA